MLLFTTYTVLHLPNLMMMFSTKTSETRQQSNIFLTPVNSFVIYFQMFTNEHEQVCKYLMWNKSNVHDHVNFLNMWDWNYSTKIHTFYFLSVCLIIILNHWGISAALTDLGWHLQMVCSVSLIDQMK